MFLATLFFFLFFISGLLVLLIKLPPGVIARGVLIDHLDVGGLTEGQAAKLIRNQADVLESRGINFVHEEKEVNLTSTVSPLNDLDLAYTLFAYEPEKAAQQALAVGRQGPWWRQFGERLSLRFFGRSISPSYFLDEKRAIDFLKDNFSSFEISAVAASFSIIFGLPANPPEIKFQPEKPGQVFDYQAMMNELRRRLEQFDATPIVLTLEDSPPAIGLKDVEALKPELARILSLGDLILSYEDKDFFIPVREWSAWLRAAKDEKVFLTLDENQLALGIKKNIPNLETELQEARFVLQDGKVMEFSPGKEGRHLDVRGTAEEIKKVLFGGAAKAKVAVEIINPAAQLAGLNEMGIQELIGTGRSDFRGSPVNRIHNIKVGAQGLNGILIAPDETFSLLKALGEVDAAHGYRPELVIKGNKTTPEFGGGLCQIGTTTFRAALASGLPILERQNHSYRVSYYEPPVGVDATIYSPRPDFKFQNDTGHYILIQTKIESTELIFEFWGTKDGRQIAQTEPIVFNRTAPPAAKLIETLDLPVGKKKCTERAHAGADAAFTYTVTYSDGTVKTQEFLSHYRPWGEVCLIGVEKLSEPIEVGGGEATSTLP